MVIFLLLQVIITMAFHTGMRTGELRGLRWPHIDREKGVIRLPAEVTRENKAKIIPMNHHLKKVLASIPQALHHDFVFTYQTAPIKSPGGLHNSFLTACKRAGIPHGQDHPEGLTFHDIRRMVIRRR